VCELSQKRPSGTGLIFVTLGEGWELLLKDLWLEGTWTVTALYRLIEWLSPGTEDSPCPERQEGWSVGAEKRV